MFKKISISNLISNIKLNKYIFVVIIFNLIIFFKCIVKYIQKILKILKQYLLFKLSYDFELIDFLMF
jgi:hypothetical protein